MTNASPSSVVVRASQLNVLSNASSASAAAGHGRHFPFCSSLELPSPSPLRPLHLCRMKCYTHQRQRSRRCGGKLPALNVWRTIHIDARKPRKAQHLPHTVTVVGLKTLPNFGQQSNKPNTGCILLNSPGPLAYIPLRREEAQKRWAWVSHVHVYIPSMCSHSHNCVYLHDIPNASNFPK
jgi:hypothetical protein